MQWGKVSGLYIYDLNGKTPPKVQFPIPFPQKVFSVNLSIYIPEEVPNGIINVYSNDIGNNGFSIITDAYKTGAKNSTVYWLAFGY